jgi:hypothetical protein
VADSASQSGSWEDLSPSEVIPELVDGTPPDLSTQESESTDKTNILNPAPGTCHACGLIVERAPGARGRVPKYHPDCRPLKSTTTRIPGVRVSAAEKRANEEADMAVAIVRRGLVKVAMMISMIDKYDAFCIMVSIPEVCANLRAVLVRVDWLRYEILAVTAGGSLLGLGLSLLTMILPMAAHHGFLPGKKIRDILVKVPYTVDAINNRLAEGEEGMMNLMREQLRQHNSAEANKRQAAPHAAAS